MLSPSRWWRSFEGSSDSASRKSLKKKSKLCGILRAERYKGPVEPWRQADHTPPTRLETPLSSLLFKMIKNPSELCEAVL